jgi:hypothetical protein
MQILINEVSFSLPAASFNMDYAVQEKRQLPVVKEFVVRLIHSLDICEPKVIANFFGFKSNEMIDVLEDLKNEGLIEWDDGEILLSDYTKDKFENVKGTDVPRFFQITEKNDDVIFDLFLFKILPKNFNLKENRLSIDVPMPNKNNSALIDNIKSAFDEQFAAYQESNNLDTNDESTESLYKINTVQNNFDVVIPIDVCYYLDTDTNDIVSKYKLDVIHEWDDESRLFNTIDDTIVVQEPKNLESNLTENYILNILDPFFVNVYDDTKSNYNVSLDNLVQCFSKEFEEPSMPEFEMIIGNIYSNKNLKTIEKYIEKIVGKNREKLIPGALWFPSKNYRTWGRTKLFRDNIQLINKIFDKRNKNANLVICTDTSENDSYEFTKTYGDAKAKFQNCSTLFNNNQIEVLLIPDVLVITLFHFDIIDLRELTIPIGFVTTNKEKIEEITKNIRKWSYDSSTDFHPFFERNNIATLDKESVFMKTVAPTLEYYEEKQKKARLKKKSNKDKK